jgi:hypothetical protein
LDISANFFWRVIVLFWLLKAAKIEVILYIQELFIVFILFIFPGVMFGENKDLALDEKGYTESKDNFCSPKVLYAVSSLESSLGES